MYISYIFKVSDILMSPNVEPQVRLDPSADVVGQQDLRLHRGHHQHGFRGQKHLGLLFDWLVNIG